MFTLDIIAASISTPPSSQVRVSGPPLERVGNTAAYPIYLENVSVPGTLNYPVADWAISTELRLIALNNNAGPSSITYTNFGANARVKISGVYQCATP